MRSFTEAFEFTRMIGSPTSYDDAACLLLWCTLERLKPGSTIIEVGCEFGRSTSLLAQATKDKLHRLVLIDPFVNNAELKPGIRLVEMLGEVGIPFTLYCMRTDQAQDLPEFAHLVHIDGDHDEAGVEYDCGRLLQKVVPGGFAVFHDYGREGLPAVQLVVDRWIKSDAWQRVGLEQTCYVVQRMK